MKRENLLRLSLSAMFIAVGYILPFFTGQIPEIGNMLLPMHLPVFLCGLICGWRYGLAVGAILPITRSLFFGMPVIFPNAVGMAVELATYGLVVGLAFALSRHKCIFALYRSLIIAMLAGRAAWGITMVMLLGFSGSAFAWTAFVAGAFTNAIPGICIQLVIIPAIMVVLQRARIPGLKGKKHENK